MRTVYFKVSKDEYMDYLNDPKGQRRRFLDRHDKSGALEYGYGFVLMRLAEKDGECFVIYDTSDTCD